MSNLLWGSGGPPRSVFYGLTLVLISLIGRINTSGNIAIDCGVLA